MKAFYKIKTMKARLLAGLSFVLLFSSACKEEINMENRYTFTGETVLSFLQKNDSLFKDYTDLLNVVKQSSKTESSVGTLLTVTTNSYTCFAPTNEAISAFLDSAYVKGVFSSNEFSVFLDSVKAGLPVSDSLAKVIVFNSIIQQKYSTDDFPKENGGVFPLPNLQDRYLTSRRDNDATGKEVFYILDDVKIIYANNELENGYVHAVDKVISPTTAGVSDLFAGIDNMQLFGRLLEMTGWSDSVSSQRYLDQNYEQIYQDRSGDLAAQDTEDAFLPEHRKYGFTIFAETDATLSEAIGLTNPDDLVEKLNTYLQGKYSGMSGISFETSEADLKRADNAINQFVAYHILPVNLAPNQLVFHYNERDYDSNSGKFGVPVFEFYETMSMAGGPRRLLKIYESRTSGKRLNRKATMDRTTYQEESVDVEGILIGGSAGVSAIEALNGRIYPIEEVLVYTNETANTVFNDRLRFDMASLLPELINLGYRRLTSKLGDKNNKVDVFFPSEFVTENIERSQYTTLRYKSGLGTGWSNSDYQGDEIMLKGNYDFTVKLPPVPRQTTYEIRLGFNGTDLRGMCQIYFAEEGSTFVPTDIPLDLRMKGYGSPEIGLIGLNVGWEKESEDQDYNERVNKTLRTKGWMKGPRYFSSELSFDGAPKCAYNYPSIVRKILTTEDLEPNKTYYLRFKSALEDPSTEMMLDYIELVPKEIYNHPSLVEDEW